MAHAKAWSKQTSDLLVRLDQYNEPSTELAQFMRECWELLEQEKPEENRCRDSETEGHLSSGPILHRGLICICEQLTCCKCK